MVFQGWAGHMVVMLRSVLPSWYRSYHRRSFSECLRFLVFFLAFQTGLRTLTFYYWNYDAFNKHSFQSCIDNFEADFPENLIFGIYDISRTRTRKRFFVQFDKQLPDNTMHHHLSPNPQTHGTTHIKLPECVIGKQYANVSRLGGNFWGI